MAAYNDITDSLPLPMDLPNFGHSDNEASASVFERDRVRLGRELARDFDEMTFSSIGAPGNIDVTDSLDIGKDANGISTQSLKLPARYGNHDHIPGEPMLHQTPTINSKILREQFADFSMAAEERDEDEDGYEIGRGPKSGLGGQSIYNNTTDFFSMAPASARTEMKRPGSRLDDRRESFSSSGSGKRQGRNNGATYGSPLQKSSVPTLDFSPSITPKRPTVQKTRMASSKIAPEAPSKIMDVLSSAGSSRSRMGNRPVRNNSEEEALSDIGRPSNIRQRVASMNPAVRKTKNDVVLKQQKGATREMIPKSFKSTPDFLKELGLDGHTQTINLQSQLQELKDVGPSKKGPQTFTARKVPEPSFMIPQMADMTDLFSANEVTRFSTKKGAAAASHFPIESIPVPHETRALLTAMKLLQDKVNSLERVRARHQQKCMKMEDELRKAEAKYLRESQRARLVEEDMRRQRGSDSTFGGSEDGDAQERNREKARIEWMMEKLKLESVISSLRHDIEVVNSQLDRANISLQNMQDDRNLAINTVAAAISQGEDLKVANNDLERQLSELKIEKEHAELLRDRQRTEFEAREARLRQRAQEAKQAAKAAEEARLEAVKQESEKRRAEELEVALKKEDDARQQRTERQRQRRLDRELQDKEQRELIEKERENVRRTEAKWEFDRRVAEELCRIRPDLFDGRSEPVVIPRSNATVEVGGRQRVIAVPKSRRARRTAQFSGESELDITHEQSAHRSTPRCAEPERTTQAPLVDDSNMSISPEEIRRIAKEINAERKRRKAAAAATAAEEAERQRLLREAEFEAARKVPLPEETTPVDSATQATAAPKRPKGRRVVKVVYLMDDDNTEVFELEREIDGDLEEALRISKIQNSAKEATLAPVPPAPLPPAPLVAPPAPETGMVSPAPNPPVHAVRFEDLPAVGQADNAGAIPKSDNGQPSRDNLPLEHLMEDHDPQQCTVCLRYERLRTFQDAADQHNPLAEVDESCLLPAPELEPVSRRPRPSTDGTYEEEPTMRPVLGPKMQLERVVRQLKDEFRHLKVMYHHKSEEFMGLDPSIGKKKRRALTVEINELVAEMGAKSDQIYALYDVNEGFVESEAGEPLAVGEETEDLIRSLNLA